jgi:hypothetical protein
MLGAGGGFGSMVVMQVAQKRPPEQAGVLRSLGPTLSRLAAAGLVLMWLTGLALVPLRYGGVEALPTLFWVKIVFVLSLTVAAVTLELTYAQVVRGDMAAAKRLPVLGPIAGASSLLAVLFAVLTFH